jgi:hypothetical protein
MTAELNEITKTSEAAIKKAGDKPDFSEAFKLLSNNTTAAEQSQERNAFNQVIQKKFPNLSLIGNDVYQDKDGKQSNGLVVFDKQTKNIELRQAENFSVVVKKEDMSAKMSQEKVTPAVAGDIFGKTMDQAVELKAKSLQAKAPENAQPQTPERAQTQIPSASEASPETLRRVQESGETQTAPAGKAASSAPGKIQESTEAAIKQNAANPDLSAVYKELSNNSTAEDQKRERTEANAALQKQFPELSLVGQQLVTDQQSGKQFESLVVYDKKTNHLQHRLAQDFSKVLSNEDVTAAVKANGLKPETAGEAIAQSMDAAVAKQPKQATAPGAAPTEQVKEFVYEAKSGDTLWHIAKTQIEAAGPKDSVASAASIKGYIEQIVARNKDQIKDAELIYAGSKYVLPDLKLPEQKAEPSEAPAPGAPGRNAAATPGEQAQAPRPREVQRPVPPTARRPEPGPDLYSGSRNGAPTEAPAPPLKK